MRIRRFHRPVSYYGYYSSFYSPYWMNSYYAPYYGAYRPGISFSFGWGNYWGPSIGWGYSNPWYGYGGFGYGGYYGYGYNPYGYGYGYGYNAGFYDGYYWGNRYARNNNYYRSEERRVGKECRCRRVPSKVQ